MNALPRVRPTKKPDTKASEPEEKIVKSQEHLAQCRKDITDREEILDEFQGDKPEEMGIDIANNRIGRALGNIPVEQCADACRRAMAKGLLH